jgi:hypothetical protein
MFDMRNMSLLDLIKAYGNECADGARGYTIDHSDEVLEEIEKRIALAKEDGVDL